MKSLIFPEQKKRLVQKLIGVGMNRGDEAEVILDGVGIRRPEHPVRSLKLNQLNTAFCPTVVNLQSDSIRRNTFSFKRLRIEDILVCYDLKAKKALAELWDCEGFALITGRAKWKTSMELVDVKIVDFQPYHGAVCYPDSYAKSGIVLAG